MGREQNPWNVPGGVYAPRRRLSGSQSRGGLRPRGNGGGFRWLWALAVCLVGYAAWGLIFGDHGIVHLRKLAAREAALKAEIAETRDRVDQLKAEAANLDRTRESRARLEFGMLRGNEINYQVSADSGAPRSGDGSQDGEAGAGGGGIGGAPGPTQPATRGSRGPQHP